MNYYIVILLQNTVKLFVETDVISDESIENK